MFAETLPAPALAHGARLKLDNRLIALLTKHYCPWHIPGHTTTPIKV
tara:strand:+ start:832 stop:972 length:141 start_codon:yes stop_codon:yes gene_type:complete